MGTQIVYVEDDIADVELARIAAADIGWNDLEITVIEDGEKAVKYFDQFRDANVPESLKLVLIDLNLPRIHGKGVLKAIRSIERLKNVLVVVISTSDVSRDADELRSLGVSAFFTKPPEYEGYKNLIKSIQNLCFS